MLRTFINGKHYLNINAYLLNNSQDVRYTVSRGGLNRTIVGLKAKYDHIGGTGDNCLNRTIVGLKAGLLQQG